MLQLQNRIQSNRGGALTIDIGIIETIRNCVGSDVEVFKRLKGCFDPGRPNRILAEICLRLFRQRQVPIIGPLEVMCLIWEEIPEQYEQSPELFFTIWPSQGYLSTREMLFAATRIARERGLTTPCLVAHPEHMPRAYFLARNICGSLATMTEVMSDEWFDPDSVQWWTRGRWRWLFYELLLARPHHRFFDWM